MAKKKKGTDETSLLSYIIEIVELSRISSTGVKSRTKPTLSQVLEAYDKVKEKFAVPKHLETAIYKKILLLGSENYEVWTKLVTSKVDRISVDRNLSSFASSLSSSTKSTSNSISASRPRRHTRMKNRSSVRFSISETNDMAENEELAVLLNTKSTINDSRMSSASSLDNFSPPSSKFHLSELYDTRDLTTAKVLGPRSPLFSPNVFVSGSNITLRTPPVSPSRNASHLTNSMDEQRVVRIFPPPQKALEILERIRDKPVSQQKTAQMQQDVNAASLVHRPLTEPISPIVEPFFSESPSIHIKLFLTFQRWLRLTLNGSLYIYYKLSSIANSNVGMTSFDWLRDQMYKSVILQVKVLLFKQWRIVTSRILKAQSFYLNRRKRYAFLALYENVNMLLRNRLKSYPTVFKDSSLDERALQDDDDLSEYISSKFRHLEINESSEFAAPVGLDTIIAKLLFDKIAQNGNGKITLPMLLNVTCDAMTEEASLLYSLLNISKDVNQKFFSTGVVDLFTGLEILHRDGFQVEEFTDYISTHHFLSKLKILQNRFLSENNILTVNTPKPSPEMSSSPENSSSAVLVNLRDMVDKTRKLLSAEKSPVRGMSLVSLENAEANVISSVSFNKKPVLLQLQDYDLSDPVEYMRAKYRACSSQMKPDIAVNVPIPIISTSPNIMFEDEKNVKNDQSFISELMNGSVQSYYRPEVEEFSDLNSEISDHNSKVQTNGHRQHKLVVKALIPAKVSEPQPQNTPFSPSICYRVKLQNINDGHAFSVRLNKIDITCLYFALQRLRQRTSLRKVLKSFGKWRNKSLTAKIFKAIKARYCMVKDEALLIESLSDIHFENSFDKKRYRYLKIWKSVTLASRLLKESIQDMRVKLDSSQYVRQYGHTMVNPYFTLCFQALVTNFHEFEPSSTEILLTNKFKRRFKLHRALGDWRHWHKAVHGMRSYDNIIYERRLLLSSLRNSEDHIFSEDLIKFTKHQTMRKALGKLISQASVPTVFFCKSDAFFQSALNKGQLATVIGYILGTENVYLNPKALKLLTESRQALRKSRERLPSRINRFKLCNRSYGYLVGKVNASLNAFSDQSTYTPSYCPSHWHIKLDIPSVQFCLESFDTLDDRVQALAKQRAHVYRHSMNKDDRRVLDNRGYPIIRSTRASSYVEEYDTHATLNYAAFEKNGDNTVSITQGQSATNRLASVCQVIKGISLTVFGSLPLIFFKRWIFRTRLKRRLHLISNNLKANSLNRLSQRMLSNWISLFDGFRSVRRCRSLGAMSKLKYKTRLYKSFKRMYRKSILVILFSSFSRFMHRTSLVRVMRQGCRQQIHIGTAAYLTKFRSFQQLRRSAKAAKKQTTSVNAYTGLKKRYAMKSFFVKLYKRVEITRNVIKVREILKQRFLFLWKWLIVEKMVYQRRQFKIWVEIRNRRIMHKALLYVYTCKIKEAWAVWINYVVGFNKRLDIIIRADHAFIIRNSFKCWFHHNKALKFDDLSSKQRFISVLICNMRRNKSLLSFRAKCGWRRFRKALNARALNLKMLLLQSLIVSERSKYTEMRPLIQEMFPTIDFEDVKVTLLLHPSDASNRYLRQPITKLLFPIIKDLEAVVITTKKFNDFHNNLRNHTKLTVLRGKTKALLREWITWKRDLRKFNSETDAACFRLKQAAGLQYFAKRYYKNIYLKALFDMGSHYFHEVKERFYLRRWYKFSRNSRIRKFFLRRALDFRTNIRSSRTIQWLLHLSRKLEQ